MLKGTYRLVVVLELGEVVDEAEAVLGPPQRVQVNLHLQLPYTRKTHDPRDEKLSYPNHPPDMSKIVSN
jgi:hypothetical protein